MKFFNFKKTIFFFAILVVAAVFFFVYFLKSVDVLENGENADETKTETSIEESKENGKKIIEKNIPENAVMVVVKKLKANQIIESPLKIEGEARGNWYFEGDFPVKLVNKNGDVLAQGIARALSDWMTTDFVPFELVLNFNPGEAGEGTIIFEKDNPSGLPENDDAYELPVFFTNGTHTTVKVYFSNPILGKDSIDCFDVYPVERTVEKTPRIGQAALEELLKGPTDEEKEKGYSTSIQEGTELRGLSIQHQVAFVDFNEILDKGVSGSCRVIAIRSQIEATLKQFQTVKEVQIYIGERSEDVLQP